ncbi:hypothetical protein Tcan_09805 [Toxocara canis]|uniref:Uncharacterized protein n=1 Tax=Toxocara canis TaxID=6265 RepID=A0A0B2VSY7_TOXCA|nr:hypothetical protein Tcan_09805 [Toxocara canis]
MEWVTGAADTHNTIAIKFTICDQRRTAGLAFISLFCEVHRAMRPPNLRYTLQRISHFSALNCECKQTTRYAVDVVAMESKSHIPSTIEPTSHYFITALASQHLNHTVVCPFKLYTLTCL